MACAVLLTFFVLPAFAAEAVRLMLPVRVWDEKQPFMELREENFKLLINDRQQEISGVLKLVASMEQRPEFLGRNFVLSFQVIEYGKQVQDAVSYFITEILNTTDSLYLYTPLNIYKFTVSSNKEKMIREVDELVKKDCDESQKRFEAAEKNLETHINRLLQQLSLDIDTDPGLVVSNKTIGTFLSIFPQEFLNFRNRYLFPNQEKYRQTLDFLGNRDGQRWWIHFQQGDIYRLMSKAHLAAKKIDGFCSLYEHVRFSFQNNLNQLERYFQLAESFPTEQLLNIFTSSNIRYNALLWENRSDKSPGDDAISKLESILNQISLDTGGKLIHTTNPEQGIKNLKGYQDHYYELAYNFDGTVGEKKIDVTAVPANGKNLKLYYKKQYAEEEIRSMVQYVSGERVQISGFSLNKNQAKFSVNLVGFDEMETFGLAKVRIELFNQGNSRAYRTENTLRSTRKDISISIPIPPQHKGTFKLVITVCDLIANRLATMEEQVILE